MDKVLEALVKEEEALSLLLEELPGLSGNIDSLRKFLIDFFLNTIEFRRFFFLFDAIISPEEEEDKIRKAISERVKMDKKIGLKLGFTPEVLKALRLCIAKKTFNREEVEKWRKKLLALKE